ncbi:hypothetical protein HYX10_02990 [Candidatus Woesearchaeota archaeon]|nr:hypothetical protein [Candidatus Woesearchaeota archaeon]
MIKDYVFAEAQARAGEAGKELQGLQTRVEALQAEIDTGFLFVQHKEQQQAFIDGKKEELRELQKSLKQLLDSQDEGKPGKYN